MFGYQKRLSNDGIKRRSRKKRSRTRSNVRRTGIAKKNASLPTRARRTGATTRSVPRRKRSTSAPPGRTARPKTRRKPKSKTTQRSRLRTRSTLQTRTNARPTRATTRPTRATTRPTRATTRPTRATTRPTRATTRPTTRPTRATARPTRPTLPTRSTKPPTTSATRLYSKTLHATHFFHHLIQDTYGTLPTGSSPRRKINKPPAPNNITRIIAEKNIKPTKPKKSRTNRIKRMNDAALLQSCNDSFVRLLLNDQDDDYFSSPIKRKTSPPASPASPAPPAPPAPPASSAPPASPSPASPASPASPSSSPLSTTTSNTSGFGTPCSTTTNDGNTEVSRQHASPSTPQPQKLPTPIAATIINATNNNNNTIDPFVVHDIDPMEIVVGIDATDDDDVALDDVTVLKTDLNKPPSEKNNVTAKTAQAQYLDFISTVLANKNRRGVNKKQAIQKRIDQINRCHKSNANSKQPKPKLSKATVSVIERIKQLAWDKLQQEKGQKEGQKENIENRRE